VLYTGLANFPAWKAAAIAGDMSLAALQVEYNLLQRAADRELIPMADYYGMAAMFYSPLAGGLLTGKYRRGAKGRLTLHGKDEIHEAPAITAIIDYLELIAREINATPGQVALRWILTKKGFPIIGARSPGQLEESLKAISIELNPDHLVALNKISDISIGYPYDLLKTIQRPY
jgi:aryl-alcohol dehydrogenase-like predicted oxidoreductase